MRAFWKQYQYYAMIAVISMIALIFLPMLGSNVGLEWRLPNTFVGWVVYVISKLIVAALNILIFHCFVLQGKLNIRDNERYIEANEILLITLHDKELEPKSPKEWQKDIYGKKGASVFLTTLLATVGLTQAILSFDLLTMLTYLVTIVFGIIFGIFSMNESEEYWTNGYWAYAQKIKKEHTDAIEAHEREVLKQQEEAERQAAIQREEEALRAEQERLAAIKRAEEEEALRKRKALEEEFKRKQEEEFQKFLLSMQADSVPLEPEPLPVSQ